MYIEFVMRFVNNLLFPALDYLYFALLQGVISFFVGSLKQLRVNLIQRCLLLGSAKKALKCEMTLTNGAMAGVAIFD